MSGRPEEQPESKEESNVSQASAALPGALAAAAAALLCVPSLLYPYGRDQGLYAYVAEGWLQGGLPYVASFDQKPPGLYAVYAAARLLYGPGMWGPRVLDAAVVLATGALAGRWAGAGAGAGALAAVAFTFATFDYWNTAQAETWQGLALAASGWLALRGEPRAGRVAAAGALGGIAFLFKFPALIPAAALGGIAAWRARSAWPILAYGAAAAAVILASLLPWALAGELATWWDVLIGYNAAYAGKIQRVLPPEVFFVQRAPLWTLVLAAVALALRRDRRVWAGLGLLALAVLTVGIQRKWYTYHWGLVVAPVAGVAALGLARLRPWPRLAAALGLALAGTLLAPSWELDPTMSWRRQIAAAAQVAAGARPITSLDPLYTGPYGFDFAGSAALGRLVAARAQPGDALCVRGFEPVVYSVSGLRCPSRFFAELPFIDDRIQYRREEWSREHAAAIEAAQPRFRVVFAPEVPRLSEAGYQRVATQGALHLMERSPAAP